MNYLIDTFCPERHTTEDQVQKSPGVIGHGERASLKRPTMKSHKTHLLVWWLVIKV